MVSQKSSIEKAVSRENKYLSNSFQVYWNIHQLASIAAPVPLIPQDFCRGA
jgi:hypothetical protein